MSGLAAFLTPESITFTVDTLVTRNDSFPMVKVNNASKVNFYPHLKCCVVALGYTQLGDDYYDFIKPLVLSDISDLVDLTERHFLNLIDTNKYPKSLHKDQEHAENLGDLYVMGYSDKNKKLCSYKITVTRDNLTAREMQMDVRKYIHPPIKEEDENRIIDEVKKIEGAGIETVLIEYMKQMARDGEKEETFTVGVGMEIQLITMMVIEGNFMCSFTTAHRFENFDEEIERMAESQEKELIKKAARIKKNKARKIEVESKISILESENKQLRLLCDDLLALGKQMDGRIK